MVVGDSVNIFSFKFIFLIILITFIYYLFPRKKQWLILLFFSFLFYLFNSTIIFILISSFVTYLSSLYLFKRKKKSILFLSISFNLLLLITLKYNITSYLFNLSFLLPLGISYYTLSIISYLVDVYHKKLKPDSYFKFLLSISFFPALIQGPIIRYNKIKDSLFTVHHFKKEKAIDGLTRILWGCFKKLVIANRIMLITNFVVNENLKGLSILLALLLYGIQIYADFSGGIDVVIGIAKIWQIDLEENFDTPYLTKSLTTFWRKWHMSLTNWFRDYVYIPLGGNRCSKIHNMLNIIIVFLLSGLWHGTSLNYLLWGLCNGIIMVGERLLSYHPQKKFFMIINYLVICSLWIFFLYPNINSIGDALISLLPLKLDLPFLQIMNIGNYIVLFLAVIVLVIIDILKYRHINFKFNYHHYEYILLLGMLFSIILFGIYGIGFDKTSFIYSRF